MSFVHRDACVRCTQHNNMHAYKCADTPTPTTMCTCYILCFVCVLCVTYMLLAQRHEFCNWWLNLKANLIDDCVRLPSIPVVDIYDESGATVDVVGGVNESVSLLNEWQYHRNTVHTGDVTETEVHLLARSSSYIQGIQDTHA